MAETPWNHWIRGFGALETLAAGVEDDSSWSESHVGPEPRRSPSRIIPHKIISRLKRVGIGQPGTAPGDRCALAGGRLNRSVVSRAKAVSARPSLSQYVWE